MGVLDTYPCFDKSNMTTGPIHLETPNRIIADSGHGAQLIEILKRENWRNHQFRRASFVSRSINRRFTAWKQIDGLLIRSVQFMPSISLSSSIFGNLKRVVVPSKSSNFHSSLKFPLKCSFRQICMENHHTDNSRGALIVLEGLDRCGKTSQSSRLVSYLKGLGHSVESWRFPDRTTSVGQMISSYLSNESQLDDHTIHLLFSANRWEKRSLMEAKLRSGTTLIVDRYSYSGVAFSSAKGLEIEWCKAPEMGLLAPDLVVYLDITPEKAAERGGYGAERYEKLEFQKKVAQSYHTLHDASWKIIDATLPIEDIEKQLREFALDCMMTCQKGKSLSQLWSC